jgi:hypothetical protein
MHESMRNEIVRTQLKESLIGIYESGRETTFLYGNLEGLEIVKLPRSNLPKSKVNVFNLERVYDEMVRKNPSFLDGMHGIGLDGTVLFWSAKVFTEPMKNKYPKNIGTREATLLELVEQIPEIELYDVNHVGVVKYGKNAKHIFSRLGRRAFEYFSPFMELIHINPVLHLGMA